VLTGGDGGGAGHLPRSRRSTRCAGLQKVWRAPFLRGLFGYGVYGALPSLAASPP
jgi:hypothetical protein